VLVWLLYLMTEIISSYLLVVQLHKWPLHLPVENHNLCRKTTTTTTTRALQLWHIEHSRNLPFYLSRSISPTCACNTFPALLVVTGALAQSYHARRHELQTVSAIIHAYYLLGSMACVTGVGLASVVRPVFKVVDFSPLVEGVYAKMTYLG
jgi:hypothetical protein